MFKKYQIQKNESLVGDWKLNLLELSGSKSSRTTPLQNFRIWKVGKISIYREEHEILSGRNLANEKIGEFCLI